MKKIICIGSSSKDIFLPTSEGIILDTPEDLTAQKKISFELGAKYQVENRYEVPGGVAVNVAQGLSRLGIKTSCYSRVGDDALGQWIKEEIAKEGVDASLMQEEKNCLSDLSAIIVDEKSGDRTIFFNRDANENLEIKRDDFKDAEWVFVSALNGNKNNSWEKNMDDILKVAQEFGIKVAINPGQRNIRDNTRKVIEGIRASKILILNKDEAIEIVSSITEHVSSTELNEEVFLIKELRNLGLEAVVLTDGLRGAWAIHDDKIYFSDSTEDQPIDSTGGGDAFASGFLAAYLAGKKIEECLQWGTANGGNVVRFYGAKEGLLNEAEIMEKIKEINVQVIE